MIQEGTRLRVIRWLTDVYDKGQGKEWTVHKVGDRYMSLVRPYRMSVIDLEKYILIIENDILYVCMTRKQFMQESRFDNCHKGEMLASGKLMLLHGNVVEYASLITPPPIYC